MLVWLKNLLPRLEAISKSLDQQELFIDQPWIFTDESGNRHQYIFMRSNELVLSVNGSVILGTWKYISAAKSLLIDTTVEKLLLNHAFIDEGVLILKRDGTVESPFILINERVIPDLNIQAYLRKKANSLSGATEITLESGEIIAVNAPKQDPLQVGTKIINTDAVHNGTYTVPIGHGNPYQDPVILEVKSNEITKVLYKKTYSSPLGDFLVLQKQQGEISTGDKILSGKIADPSFQTTFSNNTGEKWKVKVKSSELVAVKHVNNDVLFFTIIILVLIIVIIIGFSADY